jgi:oligopeptide/dipeptide ABC transporter ATP-binding protein
MPEPILSAHGLVKHFPVATRFWGLGKKKYVRAVDGVRLDVRQGETFALVGESGCGKSTLARLLIGLIAPTEGHVRFRGEDLGSIDHRRLRKSVQIVFQDPLSSLNPRKNVRHIIGRSLDIHGLATSDRDSRIRELLSLVHLDVDTLERYPHEFSGGQQQRIAIARALATQPELLVADEPVSALDVSVQAQIVSLLNELKARMNLTLLMITHDLALVNYMADQVAVMYMGKIVETGTVQQIFNAPRHPYTIGLLASTSVPDPATRGQRTPIRGEIPSPIDLPTGCRFRTRCPQRMAVCEQVSPELVDIGAGQQVACHLYPQEQHVQTGV